MSEKNKKIIVTHSSKFHTDDIFAVATLGMMLDAEGVEYEVIRTRDEAIISTADYVVDVGGVYDPAHNRFDHHQEGRAGSRDNAIPYASFGLVWKTYGETLCGSADIAEKIDQKLIQPIDAGDNGIVFSQPTIQGVYPYDIDWIRHAFMPTWKEGLKNVDSIFLNLVAFAKVLLQREIIRESDKAEAKNAVIHTYQNSTDKRLLVLDRYYPTDDFLIDFAEPLFIVFPSSDDDTWIMKTVQDDPNTYESRKDLPYIWAGKRGEELEKVTGVSDVIFCHNNRFIAVAKTREAILALAEIALNS